MLVQQIYLGITLRETTRKRVLMDGKNKFHIYFLSFVRYSLFVLPKLTTINLMMWYLFIPYQVINTHVKTGNKFIIYYNFIV